MQNIFSSYHFSHSMFHAGPNRLVSLQGNQNQWIHTKKNLTVWQVWQPVIVQTDMPVVKCHRMPVRRRSWSHVFRGAKITWLRMIWFGVSLISSKLLWPDFKKRVGWFLGAIQTNMNKSSSGQLCQAQSDVSPFACPGCKTLSHGGEQTSWDQKPAGKGERFELSSEFPSGARKPLNSA